MNQNNKYVLTQKEALKAAIDGKKVCPIDYPGITLFYNSRDASFYVTHSNRTCTKYQNEYPAVYWRIAPEYVTFEKAFAAYSSGKTIKSIFSDTVYKPEEENDHVSIPFYEIRCDWEVL